MERNSLLENIKEIDLTREANIDLEKNRAKIKARLMEGERSVVKPGKFSKFVVAACVAVLTLTATVYAVAPMIWRQLEFIIVEGEEYFDDLNFQFNVFENGFGWGMRTSGNRNPNLGRVVLDTEFGPMVFNDELILYDLNEALEILSFEPLLPAYMPDGFEFLSAEFSVNPITNPDISWASQIVTLNWTNGYEIIFMQVSSTDIMFGMYWADETEIIETYVNNLWVRAGAGAIEIRDLTGRVHYFITSFDENINLTNDTLLAIAESLQ